jgi:hypothetical protein
MYTIDEILKVKVIEPIQPVAKDKINHETRTINIETATKKRNF